MAELDNSAELKKQMPRPARKAGQSPAAKRSKALADRLTALVTASLTSAAERLLGAREEEFVLMPLNPVRVIVALSGGRDSMALLDVVAKLFHSHRQYLISRVQAVYVNHGLSPHAAEWEEHCRRECAKRDIPFAAVSVYVNAKGEGVEAAAREARYRALGRFARQSESDVVLTAHHEDDRIETFLLQWLRGAGPEGLAAFPQTRSLVSPGLACAQNENPILLVRPWISVLRADIDRYAKSVRLAWIEDESNADPKYDRNRIRHEVIPLFESIRPGFRGAAARSVALTAEAVEVLRSVAAEDLARCRAKDNPRALHIVVFLKLVPARQAWCMRAWMQEEGMQLPNRARLEEGLRQVRETHADTMLTLRVKNKEMRRWGANLIIRDVKPRSVVGPRDAKLCWLDGEPIELPNWNGTLAAISCRPGERGIAVERLQKGLLEVRVRRGGEKIKLWPLRPSKNLKDLFSEADIPAFERADLPLIWLDGELVFAAGLGLEVRACDDADLHPDRVRFEFRPEASLWGSKVIDNYAERPEPKRRGRRKKAAAPAKDE